MALYLVRHAHAGRRSAWDGPDDERPLSSKGEKEALALADRLEGEGITHLVSSPAMRCVQTIEPLAERLGLPIAVDHRLAEGSDAVDALAVVDELGAENLALCTHGDVIPDLLHLAATDSARFDHPLTWPKGSTWVLERDESGRFTEAQFIPTP